MFFKKRYHTLKVFNKKYDSLNRNFVFSSDEFEKLEKVIDFLLEKKESWDLNPVFDVKDNTLSPEKVLSVFHKVDKYKHIEKAPESIENLEEFFNYIEEKEAESEQPRR
jgi:hypothetical protein